MSPSCEEQMKKVKISVVRTRDEESAVLERGARPASSQQSLIPSFFVPLSRATRNATVNVSSFQFPVKKKVRRKSSPNDLIFNCQVIYLNINSSTGTTATGAGRISGTVSVPVPSTCTCTTLPGTE